MLHDRKPKLENSVFCGTGIAKNGNDLLTRVLRKIMVWPLKC